MIKIKRRKNYHHQSPSLPAPAKDPRLTCPEARWTWAWGWEGSDLQPGDALMYLSSCCSRDSFQHRANGWPSLGNLLQNYLPSDGDYLLTELYFMALILLSLMGRLNPLFHFKRNLFEMEGLKSLNVVVLNYSKLKATSRCTFVNESWSRLSSRLCQGLIINVLFLYWLRARKKDG